MRRDCVVCGCDYTASGAITYCILLVNFLEVMNYAFILPVEELGVLALIVSLPSYVA